MSTDKSPKRTKQKDNYQDPTSLAPKNLEIGLWVVNNRKLIYKITVFVLGAIATSLILYSGYSYFYYFVFGQEQDKILSQDTSGLDLAAYRERNIPLDLLSSRVKALSNNTGTDFIAHLKNPNEKQFARFNFCFITGETKTCGSSFILPNEEKDVLLLNSNLKNVSGGVVFELSNIVWQKLKAGEIPDWSVYKKQRLNIVISSPKFFNYGEGVNYLVFSVKNDTPYSYFEVPLNIVIANGSEVLAINRYVINELNSQETKNINLSWNEAANLGGQITISPDLDVLNTNVYKPYLAN